MSQINSVAPRKDDSLDMIVNGLQVYRGIQDMSNSNKQSMPTTASMMADNTEAMKRRLGGGYYASKPTEAMNQEGDY